MAVRQQGRTTTRRLGKAVLLLAAVSALSMPVSYTGGRSVAHPHAFVQLFFDAAHGTTNHHSMSAIAHHAPPVHRDIFLVDVPDDTPIVSVSGGAMERVALIGSVLAAGYALLLAGLPRIGSGARRLSGIVVIPDSPPPRFVAVF